MANTLNELLIEIQELVNKVEAIAFGGETTTVTYKGESRSSLLKYINDQFLSLKAMIVGRAPYELLADLVESGAPDADAAGNFPLSEVWNDPVEGSNGLYGWDGSSWVKSLYDSAISLSKVVDEIMSVTQRGAELNYVVSSDFSGVSRDSFYQNLSIDYVQPSTVPQFIAMGYRNELYVPAGVSTGNDGKNDIFYKHSFGVGAEGKYYYGSFLVYSEDGVNWGRGGSRVISTDGTFSTDFSAEVGFVQVTKKIRQYYFRGQYSSSVAEYGLYIGCSFDIVPTDIAITGIQANISDYEIDISSIRHSAISHEYISNELARLEAKPTPAWIIDQIDAPVVSMIKETKYSIPTGWYVTPENQFFGPPKFAETINTGVQEVVSINPGDVVANSGNIWLSYNKDNAHNMHYISEVYVYSDDGSFPATADESWFELHANTVVSKPAGSSRSYENISEKLRKYRTEGQFPSTPGAYGVLVGASIGLGHSGAVEIFGFSAAFQDKPFVEGAQIKSHMAPGYSAATTEEHVNLKARVLAVESGAHNGWFGKKILWLGTSIPASGKYPERVGEMLGCNVINNANGGAVLRNARSGGSQLGSNHKKLAFSAEESWYQTEYGGFLGLEVDANYRPSPGSGVVLTQEMIDSDLKSKSYERLLLPHLDADLVVFDFGYNDLSQQVGDFDISQSAMSSNDRSEMIGAFNYVVDKFHQAAANDGKRARFAIVEHHSFHNSVDGACSSLLLAQRALAEKYHVPICNLADLTGFWSPDVLAEWIPDHVHPHSDASGKTKELLSTILSGWLRGF